MIEEGSYRMKCETEMNLNKVSIEIYDDNIDVLIEQIKMTLLGCGYQPGTLEEYFK